MVLCGEMGSGKSIIIEMMNKHIFGSNCGHQTQGLKSICSRFQGWLENKLIVLAEEPTQMTDMNFSEYVENMKDFITSNKCEVEKKGIEKYTIDAYHNLIITCNHLKGIHIPNDKERRYFIVDCNSCYIGNTNYFNKLNECLDNKDNMNVLFSYLYDYNDVVPLQPIPMTKLKKEIIDDNMPIYEKFLFHKELRYDFNFEEEMSITKLYEIFTKWYEKMGFNKRFIHTNDKFSKEMNTYGKSKQVRSKYDKDHRYYIFEFNEDTIKKIKELEEE